MENVAVMSRDKEERGEDGKGKTACHRKSSTGQRGRAGAQSQTLLEGPWESLNLSVPQFPTSERL